MYLQGKGNTMKRSLINAKIKAAKEFFAENHFYLPDFAFWKPAQWENLSDDYQEITDNKLGWDMTDFGGGDFEKQGLLLFTLRNGNPYDDKYIKTYAEKIMVVEEEQVTPYHYHWFKTEDIINRGGGNLVVKLYQSTEDDELSDESFSIKVDGRKVACEAGQEITLTPGQSITLVPKVYHAFWAEKGTGKVMAGEVSQTNDDNKDNRFYDDSPRFSEVEEDCPKDYVLVNEY